MIGSSLPIHNSAAMPWDLDLCMNSRQEPLIPFTLFAAPKPPSSPTFLKSFSRFPDLGVNIHLLTYKACDASTLFQLMHTCSKHPHRSFEAILGSFGYLVSMPNKFAVLTQVQVPWYPSSLSRYCKSN
ncbi:hypothetical protein K469DRAFT_325311 [Zopfia rhizophila CBS 207.26]|uniref:Uncharacterized protein n=1 Tax=Zopfia rhizophila CBS 207.26 TaxID=1314779 RepID=A0A6A6DHA0_9PEZI|nr:hypothetical protein K469DRAFT_325311 [Zopfia rhizophila CBS 207.26]